MMASITFALLLAWSPSGRGMPSSTPHYAHKHSVAVAHGWLSPSVHSRIIRFVSETKVEGNHKVFVPFQTSGFIFLFNDTFSISVAQPNDVLLLKYKDGSLSRTGSVLSADRHSKRLSFTDALSGALDEVVSEGVGEFCKTLMSRKGDTLRSYEKVSSLSSGAHFEAVVGDNPGDLQKFTVTWPNMGDGVQKTVCTFTVVLP